MVFATSASQPHVLPEAAAATALYVPLHLRHVRYGLRGQRPRHLPVTLGAMAIIVVGATPLLGADWLYAWSALMASVLVATPSPFAFPAVACILAGVGLWASRLNNGFGIPLYGAGQSLYFPLGVADRAATVFVLVWLVGALRRVQSARGALAEAALQTERERIDAELRASVGAELEDIVRTGTRAKHAVRQDPLQAAEELNSLVKGSRRALANARRMIRGYQFTSPAAELEKVALLLRAAGIETTVAVAGADVPSRLDQSARTALQETVARLLSQAAAGPIVLKLDYSSGQFRLETTGLSAFEAAE